VLGPLLLAAALSVTAQSRSLQPGELVVLTIVAPAAASVSVRAFDRDITPFSIGGSRWRALIGIDLGRRPGTYRIRVDADGRREHTFYTLVVKPRQFRTRRLTVNPDFVTPPASARERINRDTALLNQAFRSSSAARLWESEFVRPVPDAANSAFGTRSVFRSGRREQRVRHAQRLQRPAPQPAQRRRLHEQGWHAHPRS
jgi:hypothetical protein